MGNAIAWSEEELALLKTYFPHHSNSVVSKKINDEKTTNKTIFRSPSSVATAATHHCIYKSDAYTKAVRKRARDAFNRSEITRDFRNPKRSRINFK
jgi:hypothetical protein